MARSLIFIRLTLGFEDIGSVRDYVEDMRAALRDFAGFVDIGGWKGVDDPYTRLVLISYESPEAAARAPLATEGVKTLAERLHEETTTPDVKFVAVEHADGRFVGCLPLDACVAASARLAEPGYGPEMVDDFTDVFGGMIMLPGYAGSLVGTEAKMADDVIGLDAWESPEAFAASMPESRGYTVTLYEPIGEA